MNIIPKIRLTVTEKNTLLQYGFMVDKGNNVTYNGKPFGDRPHTDEEIVNLLNIVKKMQKIDKTKN